MQPYKPNHYGPNSGNQFHYQPRPRNQPHSQLFQHPFSQPFEEHPNRFHSQPQNPHPKRQSPEIKGLKFSQFVFKFINQLLFDQKIDTKNKYFVQNLKNLNNELQGVRISECVDVLDSIINSKEKVGMTISIAHEVLIRCLDFPVRNVFMNAYINIMKRYKEEQKNLVNRNQIEHLVDEIPAKNLPYFCEAFDLQLNPRRLQLSIEKLCKNGDYNTAIWLAKLQKDPKIALKIIQNYVMAEEDYKTVEYVSGQIVKLEGTKAEFQKLHEKCLRMQMDHFIKDQGYDCAEEIYRGSPVLLNILVNQMNNDPRVKKTQFLSFCRRNPEVLNYFRDQKLLSDVQDLKREEPNKLQTDFFGPSDKKYFSLSDFGIKEEDVVFLNSSTPDLELFLDYIQQVQVLGLDTESYVPRSKFSTDEQLLATIQISDGRKVFIIDARDCANPRIGSVLAQFFYDPDKILVGHTLEDDLDTTLKVLGVVQKVQCKCVDVKLEFKELYPDAQRGLQAICQRILGKPICKEYTLTDWLRRPLLKNQVHYAALDAVVVIHIFEKLQQKKPKNPNSKKPIDRKIKLI